MINESSRSFFHMKHGKIFDKNNAKQSPYQMRLWQWRHKTEMLLSKLTKLFQCPKLSQTSDYATMRLLPIDPQLPWQLKHLNLKHDLEVETCFKETTKSTQQVPPATSQETIFWGAKKRGKLAKQEKIERETRKALPKAFFFAKLFLLLSNFAKACLFASFFLFSNSKDLIEENMKIWSLAQNWSFSYNALVPKKSLPDFTKKKRIRCNVTTRYLCKKNSHFTYVSFSCFLLTLDLYVSCCSDILNTFSWKLIACFARFVCDMLDAV